MPISKTVRPKAAVQSIKPTQAHKARIETIRAILRPSELRIVERLNTPHKIQSFLDKIPFNLERNGETYMSPRLLMRERIGHCFEAAMFSALCLTYHSIPNYILDLKIKSKKKDTDHVVCVFKMSGHLGAISKTNHAVLRWRDPIYPSGRALALSYFHEYFVGDGTKTLHSFSRPFNIFSRFGTSWITEEERDLSNIVLSVDNSIHMPLIPKKNRGLIRKATKTEIRGAGTIEWKKN